MKILKNIYVKAVLDIAVYLIIFIALQAVMLQLSVYGVNHYDLDKGNAIALGTIVSGALTILLFARFGWSPYSREYISTRPWLTLIWVALLSAGTILPSQWMIEAMGAEMPKDTAELMGLMMGSPLGYMAIGILAPVAEEMVLRGAILRKLLDITGHCKRWFAILVSALLFGLLHGNTPQFIHATLIGLLLGWMYCRTDSIVPGIVFHWINNTIAFIAFHMLPQAQDGKLTDIFAGNERGVYMAVGFSLCIFLPSLFQLAIRLRKKV